MRGAPRPGLTRTLGQFSRHHYSGPAIWRLGQPSKFPSNNGDVRLSQSDELQRRTDNKLARLIPTSFACLPTGSQPLWALE